MCGIAGIYGKLPVEKKRTAADRLTNGLAHRGPDGHRVYEDDMLSLMHARLSIIDLSECGYQPLYNEDKSLVLICNGEIYNYKQLTNDLIRKGHTFSSHSDSEVILHLYEEHGGNLPELLNDLTGMFAFALWDKNKKQLFVARDRIGIKPLYYHYSGKELVFSSEVKPLAEAGLFTPTIDHTSLYEYFLLGSIPGPNTMFSNIKSLEPGHYMAVHGEHMSIHKYWDIPLRTKKWSSDAEVTYAVEQLLTGIVKDHLVADVPVGVFLSAGVDSSLITAIAAKHHPGIHSFTASFPGEPEDEGIVSAATAKKLGTTHHTYAITNNFFEDFPVQFKDMDQPFAINSALSLGRISRLAKKTVKVVLSGDGGDELFGGYNRHVFAKTPPFLNMIPAALHDSVLKAGAKVTGKKSLEKLRTNLKIPEGEKFLGKIAVNTPETAIALLAPNVRTHVDRDRFKDRLNRLFSQTAGADKLNAVLYADMKTTLVDEMLTKCDRMTMINGIEGRVPFLDHRLVELAFSIPSAYKRNETTGKLPLRKILAKHLGHELAYRDKTGFNSPLQQWLQKDEATRRFVRESMEAAKTLSFLDTQHLQTLAAGTAPANELFELVCIQSFFKNLVK